jgi:DNA-binding response OmpR family regulator
MQTTTISSAPKPQLNLIKVLVIEDDKETAEVVQMFLSMNGYQPQIETATTDISGLLENYNPDLLIVDYLLPFINGGELCARVKKDNNWKHLPVIIYSAYPRVINSLGNYNCDAFLPKPFNLNTF